MNIELNVFLEDTCVVDNPSDFFLGGFRLAPVLRALELVMLHLVHYQRFVEVSEAVPAEYVFALTQHLRIRFGVRVLVLAVADAALESFALFEVGNWSIFSFRVGVEQRLL